MQDILEAVKNELKVKLNKDQIDDYDEISIDTAVDVLEAEGLPVYSDFRANLTTPWAIARYIQLSLEEKQLVEKVEADLKKFIPENIEIAFLKKFSCVVHLSKTFVEGEKRQTLAVKYTLDEDEGIHYKLTTNGAWCWDITKAQLSALLKNEIVTPELKNDWKINKKPSFIKRFLKKIFGFTLA